jgi:hypothetical protein
MALNGAQGRERLVIAFPVAQRKRSPGVDPQQIVLALGPWRRQDEKAYNKRRPHACAPTLRLSQPYFLVLTEIRWVTGKPRRDEFQRHGD